MWIGLAPIQLAAMPAGTKTKSHFKPKDRLPLCHEYLLTPHQQPTLQPELHKRNVVIKV